tara:strand:+ start:129 stop:791 length:663 start_codon:yes stop_codon:yes gene_type:complete
MTKIIFLLLLFSVFTSTPFADNSAEWPSSIYDKWSDSVVCNHLNQKPSHQGYLEEVKKRNLACGESIIVSGISNSNELNDWTDEDLCRWLDSSSIPKPLSNEIIARNLSCYVSCYSDELTSKVIDCNKQETIIEFDMLEIDGDNKNEPPIKPYFTPINPVFDGVDMSGFNPPKISSTDIRIYYINGIQLEASSTYIDALLSYLESSGQKNVFSFNPPEVK